MRFVIGKFFCNVGVIVRQKDRLGEIPFCNIRHVLFDVILPPITNSAKGTTFKYRGKNQSY